MSGISVEVLPDSGAPQVGVTVDGLPPGSASVVTVERSTDGLSWKTVQGVLREDVMGSAFFRDFVPPLNVACTYRVVTTAAFDPVVAFAWTGAAHGSTSTRTEDGEVRLNRFSHPHPQSLNTAVSAGWAFQNGTGEATTASYVADPGAGPAGSTGFLRRTVTAAKTDGSSGWYCRETSESLSGPAGDTRSGALWVRFSHPVTVVGVVYFRLGATGVTTGGSVQRTIPADTWTRVSHSLLSTASYDGVQVWGSVSSTTPIPVGGWYDVSLGSVTDGPELVPYWDGDTEPVPAPTAATITVASDSAWMQDPLDPRSAVPVACVRGVDGLILLSPSAGEIARAMPADLVQVQGARLPVASLGVRQAPAGVQLHLRAITAAQGALVKALAHLVDTAGTVVLRGLPADVPLDPVAHVIAPDVRDSPVVDGLLGPRRDWVMSVTQVRAPSPRIAVPWWTYDQVRALWAGFSYDQVTVARPGATYLDWLRDPTPEAS